LGLVPPLAHLLGIGALVVTACFQEPNQGVKVTLIDVLKKLLSTDGLELTLHAE